jgi:16S rRNA (uracil1498-N3)-methyltransferase
MELFLATIIDASNARLEGQEARHCQTVLRKGAGEEIMVTDGKGMAWRARIHIHEREKLFLDLLESFPNYGEPPVKTTLLFALLKNRDRMDWILEKAVELGVTRLVPMICNRSERDDWNQERSHRVLVSALKQCQRSRIPELDPAQNFAHALRIAQLSETRFIATANDNPTLPIERWQSASVAIAIGPEGDFTPAEIAAAEAVDFEKIHLGKTRLRSETAAMHALSIRKRAVDF